MELKESSRYRPPFPGWDRGPSAGTASPAGVLLGLYRSFRGQKRLRTHGDGHGQYLGLSAERLVDVISPQLKAEFERKKNILACLRKGVLHGAWALQA